MNRWTIAALVAAIVVAVLIGATFAYAGERGDWFKSLKQPTTGLSCCDISDCKADPKARWHDGQWHADAGDVELTPVSSDRVVRDQVSIDGSAYTCAARTTHYIYCFIPPSPGS